MLLPGGIVQQETCRLNSVAGRVHYFYLHITEGKHFSIFGYIAFIAGLGIGTKHNVGTGIICQIDMTGNKIGMKVGLKNVLNSRASLCSLLLVGTRIAQGVNNGSLSGRLNVVCRMGKTIRVDLLDVHNLGFKNGQ
jgi:hypothetical protein